jgi:hypothetical protein
MALDAVDAYILLDPGHDRRSILARDVSSGYKAKTG